MEQLKYMKHNEQFPLLKVENAEAVTRQPTPTARRQLKRVLYDGWPTVLSGYWTLIAILMTLGLIVYSMNMNWHPKSTSFLSDNLTYKPATKDKFFFYHVILMGMPPAFSIYSHFLNTMAYQHPSLELNVCFLIDDSRLTVDVWLRPYSHYTDYNSKYKRDWHAFEKKYDNVKISFMRLSSFMAKTPLKYHWRTVPLSFLSFYARVFSVWKHGGVGMDLFAYNNRFIRNLHLDRRVCTILTNHNDQSETNYNVLMGPIDQEEENCLIHLGNRILNETSSIFNKLLPLAIVQDMKTFLLPFLNTSSFTNEKYTKNDKNGTETNNNNTTTGNISIYNDKNDIVVHKQPPEVTNEDNIAKSTSYVTFDQSEYVSEKLEVNETQVVNKSDTADSDGSHIVLLYDLFLTADNVDQRKLPPRLPPWSADISSQRQDVARLVLNSDGTFVAATQKNHRFLEILLKVTVLHKLPPSYVIRKTFLTECSVVFKYEDYCNFYHL